MTRKEQKEERRKAILMTALNLFVEKGYYDTKITDIAKAASMSTGLMFHYFESKEELLLEVVKMGAQGTKALSSGADSDKMKDLPPDVYLKSFLTKMFDYANEQPWVFYMFVLMGQVRRAGMPEKAREAARQVDSIEFTAKIIRKGQKQGIFRKGDPKLLATCFWASVQGIMEEMAAGKDLRDIDPEWLMAMLRKE